MVLRLVETTQPRSLGSGSASFGLRTSDFGLPISATRAFTLLAETDVQLKGSKRDPGTLLEETVLRLCVGT